jgi:ankyrin repeat protein
MLSRFKFVPCQIDLLRRCLPVRIRCALDELPDTLDATYKRSLLDIQEERWRYAHRVFQCIAVASRPLHIKELAEIFAIDFEARPIPKLVKDCRPEDPIQALLSTCSSLIAVVKGPEEVQFSHFSVKEFLMSSHLEVQGPTISRFRVLNIPAHTMVAQACLGTLLHLNETVTEESLKQFPLAEYAAQYWVLHAQFDDQSPTIIDGTKLLFDPRKPHFKVWIWLFDPDASPSWRRQERPSEPPGTPLHFAAFYGLCVAVEFLIVERSQDVNARRLSDDRAPLFIASERGHAKVTGILLQHGATANDRDVKGLTPLHQASRRGHVEVVQNLLIHDADINSRDNENLTPFHLASFEGHLEVARLLLDRGADMEILDNANRTPLFLAVVNEQRDLAEFLLKRGADPDYQGRNIADTTPLHQASAQGDPDIVQLLLDHKANVNARNNKDNTTPLFYASLKGEIKLLQLLLGYRADANANNQTSLHMVSQHETR